MSQNNFDGNGYGQANSSGYGHPNQSGYGHPDNSGYGQHLARSSGYDHQVPSGYDHQTPSGYGRRSYHQSGPYTMQTPDYPILPPLPSPTITPTAAQAYFEGGYRAWEEICRLNGILQPHQAIPHPSTMHPSLPPSGPSNPPFRPSNPPPRQGPPPTRAPNPLNPRQNPGFRQNRPSAPSTISRPVTGARVQRTFQGQVRRRMEDVQCFNCKELGHPLKYCTVVGDHGFIFGCPRCNAGHFYDSCTNSKKRANDNRYFLAQLRDGLCPIASDIDYRAEEGFMERGHRPLTPGFALQHGHLFHDYDYTTKERRARDPLMDHPETIPSSLITYDAVVATANSSTITSSAAPFSSASDQVDDLIDEIRQIADYGLPAQAQTLEDHHVEDLDDEIRQIADWQLPSEARNLERGDDDLADMMDLELPREKLETEELEKEKGMEQGRGQGV